MGVGWANSFIVNPTFSDNFYVGCQRDGSPTYELIVSSIKTAKSRIYKYAKKPET